MKYGVLKTGKRLTAKMSLREDAGVLRKWNFLAAGLLAIQAAALLILSVPRNFPINLSYLATDSLQSKLQGTSVVAPAVHQVFSLNLVYPIVAALLIAAAMQTLVATLNRHRYEDQVTGGESLLRSAQFSLEMACIAVAVGLIAGMYDLGSLLLIIALEMIAGLSLVGSSVRAGKGRTRPLVRWLITGVAVGLPFVVVFLHVIASSIFGGVTLQLYVLLVCITWLAMAAGLGLNNWLIQQGSGAWGNKVFGEKVYVVMNFIALSALGWELFAHILRP